MGRLFTSDLHFGHNNILSIRPEFDDIEKMDEYLIRKWNEKVTDDDEVYILGDLSYRCQYHISYYLDRMKGKKHLIIGNHDSGWMKNVKDMSQYFESVDNMLILNEDGKTICLSHYPMLEWPRSRYAYQGVSYLIHGHLHNNRECMAYKFIKNNLPTALNCGVDVNGYEPVTFEELIENNNRWYGRGNEDKEYCEYDMFDYFTDGMK